MVTVPVSDRATITFNPGHSNLHVAVCMSPALTKAPYVCVLSVCLPVHNTFDHKATNMADINNSFGPRMKSIAPDVTRDS